MFRLKPVKNGVFGAGRISGVVVAACLIAGWSRPAHSDEPAAAPEEQSHLQLAPIDLYRSFGGNLGYYFNRTSSGPNHYITQSLGLGVYAGVHIGSFFWQPWLAQISSNLRVDANSNDTKSSKASTYGSLHTGYSGDATLGMLKYSRFPFEARVFRNDNKMTSLYSGANTDYQLTGYSLKQDYTSPNRLLSGGAFFQSSKVGDPANPADVDSLALSLSTQLSRYNTVLINGNSDKQYQPSNDMRFSSDSLLVNHAYRPNNLFSMANLANLYKFDMTQGNKPVAQPYNSTQQFTSFASLRPERTPLTITGSARIFYLDGDLATTQRKTNFNLGANYLFSALIRMYGSVNVADDQGVQTVTSNAALTAAKAFQASTNVGGFRYSGSIGGSVASNNQTRDSATQRSQNLGLYLSHSLAKTTRSGGGNLTKELHQTISTTVGSNGSSSSRLSSGGGLSWSQGEGKGSTLLSLSATDSRYLNGSQNTFQMLNLQATRSETLSRNESLSGNLTVQATHAQFLTQDTVQISPSAQMYYSNNRLFKVMHLNFVSTLSIIDTNIAPTQNPQYINSPTRSWDNNFAYTIGRTDLKLVTRIAKVKDLTTTSISFRFLRQF